MSEQNKQIGPLVKVPTQAQGAGGVQADKKSKQPDLSPMPEHEPGREHVPNVEALKKASDSLRTTERVPEIKGREAHTTGTQHDVAGDAKRTVAESDDEGKEGRGIADRLPNGTSRNKS